MKSATKAKFILSDLKVILDVTFADGSRARIPMVLPKRYRKEK